MLKAWISEYLCGAKFDLGSQGESTCQFATAIDFRGERSINRLKLGHSLPFRSQAILSYPDFTFRKAKIQQQGQDSHKIFLASQTEISA